MARPVSLQGAMVLTGLVAHTAQYGPDLDAECFLSLLKALVHKINYIIRGDVPSVWREEEVGLQAKGRPWAAMELKQGGAALPLNCLPRRLTDTVSSPYAVPHFLRLPDPSVGVSGSPPYF